MFLNDLSEVLESKTFHATNFMYHKLNLILLSIQFFEKMLSEACFSITGHDAVTKCGQLHRDTT